MARDATEPAEAAPWLRDPAAIYRLSFELIRKETDLGGLPETLVPLALRMVHACGMPEIVRDLAWTDDAPARGREALAAGAPIVVDSRMVAAGITAAGPAVACLLDHPEAAARARACCTTRAAAAVELARDRLPGSITVIGNAPTALLRLLELLRDGLGPPALVIGLPVGFVGAAESKEALIAFRPRVPHVALRGRLGGSAMAAAAVNALLADLP
jgi:precorrin-8X/cobalt-precorrin-8 methylmutase